MRSSKETSSNPRAWSVSRIASSCRSPSGSATIVRRSTPRVNSARISSRQLLAFTDRSSFSVYSPFPRYHRSSSLTSSSIPKASTPSPFADAPHP